MERLFLLLVVVDEVVVYSALLRGWSEQGCAGSETAGHGIFRYRSFDTARLLPKRARWSE